MKIDARSLLFLLFLFIVVSATGATDYPEQPPKSFVDSLGIDEIVVTGSRPSVSLNNLPMSVRVVTGEQLERRFEPSLLPVLTEQVPSLFITSRGIMGYGVSTGSAGGMTMRGIGGGPTTQLLVLIDGHPQYMGLMGHPLADSYQTSLAERVEVVRGPASVLYGSNAMGGVMNIITKEQEEDGADTRFRAMYGSYNTVSAEASNGIRAGKFNSYASFGYNRSDGHRENMGFEQYTGYARLGYDMTRNWKAFTDLEITNFESSNPGTIFSPMFDNDMNVTRGSGSVSVQNSYDRTSGALKFYYNFGYHKINDGYATGGTPRESRYRSRDRMLGVTAYQNYSFFRGNQTTVGIDYTHFGGHAWNTYINGNPDNDLARESLNEVAAYVNFQQLLWSKVTLNAGIRIDHHSVTGTEWIPQFGISYFAGKNTVLKAIVSKGYRNPTIRELYMFGIRNADLDPESLMNYEVSLTQSFLQRRLQFGLNLYYIKGKNSIILDQAADGYMWMNTGKLENYGVEVTADYRIRPDLGVNANYSYLHMEYPVVASPEHKLYAGLDYRLKRWNFGTGLQYIHNLITEEADPDTGAPAEKDSFLLWNVRVSYRPLRFMEVFVRGENLLAQRYEINRGFPMPRATVFGGLTFRF